MKARHLMALVFVLSLATLKTAHAWVTEVVDSAGDVGEYTSIALDSSEKAHISCWDSTNDDLKYATNASGSWVATTVDSEDVNWWTSLALDMSGKIHISYHISYHGYPSQDDSLKYATNASGSWVIETVDSAGEVGADSSIALDSSGMVHISYLDWTNRDLKYATNTSGSWVTITVESTGSVGHHTSIALDSLDKVHISYSDRSSGDLKYATNASGSWVATTVESTGSVGDFTSIAVDSFDKVHISYWDSTNRILKYTTNRSGSWVNMIACNRDEGSGESTSIALTSQGSVRISHHGGDGTLLITSSLLELLDPALQLFAQLPGARMTPLSHQPFRASLLVQFQPLVDRTRTGPDQLGHLAPLHPRLPGPDRQQLHLHGKPVPIPAPLGPTTSCRRRLISLLLLLFPE